MFSPREFDLLLLLFREVNFPRISQVEQLLKDQSLLDAYDLVDQYCEFIILHFPYIRKHKYDTVIKLLFVELDQLYNQNQAYNSYALLELLHFLHVKIKWQLKS